MGGSLRRSAAALLALFALQASGQATDPEPAVAVVDALQEKSLRERLHTSPVWAALLHVHADRPQLRDPGFLLSGKNFSLERELHETIRFLFAGAPANVCRFPARYLWLRRTLATPALPLDSCQELTEFTQRAPAAEIALVYASENLSQPSSMMGHLFLKLTGLNNEGHEVAHAISFYTDAATLNLPKLLFDSMVVGKQGYFALSPYDSLVQTYMRRERRNLWEYELDLNEDQRALVQAHLIELKHTDITYFFQKYNCATLIKHIIALAKPAILEEAELWSTPKKVLQQANRQQLIRSVSTRMANRWAIRLLAPHLDHASLRQIRKQVMAMRTDELPAEGTGEPAIAALEIANAYNNHLFDERERNSADWHDYGVRLRQLRERQPAAPALAPDSAKDPLSAPPDSQLALSFQKRIDGRFLVLDILPVSHTLDDDNSQYFSENELRLFDFSISKHLNDSTTSLERAIIYSAQSVLPRDAFTGGLSGGFKLGMDRQVDEHLQPHRVFQIRGNAGVAFGVRPDTDIYALGGLGLGARAGAYLFPSVTLGVFARAPYSMKSSVSASWTANELGAGHDISRFSFTQAKYFGGNVTLVLGFTRQISAQRAHSDYHVTLKKLF